MERKELTAEEMSWADIKTMVAGFAIDRKAWSEEHARRDEERQENWDKGMQEFREEMAKKNADICERLEANMASSQKAWEERQAKTEASIAKLEANTTRLETIVEKNNAKLDENTARLEKNNAKLDENTARLEKNNAKLDENTYEMGQLTNKLGGIIESVVVPDIVGKFNEKGFKFDSVSTRVQFLNEDKKGRLAEVDALLENGTFVIAVEAKTEIDKKDVNDHVNRLNKLRGLSRFNGKQIYGALATAVAKKEPIDYALEQGFYVLQQPNVMGVKILDFPKGRSAKAW
jgi:DNA repair exonuclease SbcCD ATPase subunit